MNTVAILRADEFLGADSKRVRPGLPPRATLTECVGRWMPFDGW
jgi:hypothetical protein